MPKFLTKQNAKIIGSLGGRPKGVLNKKTIDRIKDKQAFEEECRKRAGMVLDNLLIGSNLQDTRASEIILDRGFGKVPQGVNVQSVQFSLKELAEYRKNLLQGDQQDALQNDPKDVLPDVPAPALPQYSKAEMRRQRVAKRKAEKQEGEYIIRKMYPR